ncbi:YceD family protein [Thermohalobacter berrensis]|uniref:YceD family protein n=1 Tax=Thermohalobacter berrensis TaxID=99594 RepID=UPI00160324D7|nr:YceD family protein [Thermohalobacter berrensis]
MSKLIDGTESKISFDETADIKKIKTKDREIILTSPVKVTGNVFKTNDGLYLSANITYEYSDECARCLKEVKDKVDTSISGRLVEKEQKNKIENDEDETEIFYEGNEVDLDELTINTILLSLPMRVLCNEECRGICPKCGQDLNEVECNCEDDNIDPRFAKLKELLD